MNFLWAVSGEMKRRGTKFILFSFELNELRVEFCFFLISPLIGCLTIPLFVSKKNKYNGYTEKLQRQQTDQ